MTLLDTLLVRLTGDSSGYLKSLNQAKAATQATAKAIHGQAVNITGFAGALAGFMASAQMAKGLFNVTKAFGEFDLQMTKSLSIIPDVTKEQRVAMEELAKEISGRSITSADKLAQSYYFLASAGLDAAQSIAVLSDVEQFAVAGSFDMNRATTLLMDTLGSLDLKVAETSQLMLNTKRAAGVLVRGNQLANTSTEELAAAMTRFAPVMKTYGISLEHGAAILDAFAEKGGLKGVTAGSAAQRMVQLLTGAALKSKELEKIVFEPDTGKLRDVDVILDRIKNSIINLTDIKRAGKLKEFGFEVRIQKVLLPLLKMGPAIRKWHDQLKNVGDTNERVANVQLQAFVNQMIILRNQFQVMVIEIGKVFTPALIALNKVLRSAIKLFRGLSEGWKVLISWLGGITGAILVLVPLLSLLGPLLLRAFAPLMLIGGKILHVLHLNVILGALLVPLKIVVRLMKILGTGLLLLLNPIALVKAAVTGLWATIMFFFGPEMTLIFTILKIVAVLAIFVHQAGGVQNAIDLVVKSFQDLWEWLKPIRLALGSMFSVAFDALQDLIFYIGEDFLHILEGVLKWLGVDWANVWEQARMGAVTAIVAIEYAIKNFRQLLEVATAAGIYGLLRFENELVHLFEEVIPNYLLGTAFGVPVKIKPRIPTGPEKEALAEFKRQAGVLGDNFNHFLKDKLEEFKSFTNIGTAFKAIENKAGNSGRKTGEEWANAFGKAMKKVDAIVVGSSEHFELLENYLDMIRDRPKQGDEEEIGGAGAGGGDPNDLVLAPTGGNAGRDPLANQMLDVLVDIRDNTKDQLKKEPGTLIPAGLA